jgi:hypothetical protein
MILKHVLALGAFLAVHVRATVVQCADIPGTHGTDSEMHQLLLQPNTRLESARVSQE